MNAASARITFWVTMITKIPTRLMTSGINSWVNAVMMGDTWSD